jgi:hypothetical protein
MPMPVGGWQKTNHVPLSKRLNCTESSDLLFFRGEFVRQWGGSFDDAQQGLLDYKNYGVSSFVPPT